jgi:hypothetical protein
LQPFVCANLETFALSETLTAGMFCSIATGADLTLLSY